jgi:Cu/Ag efflux pump CusA
MPGKPRYTVKPIRLFQSDFLEFFSHVRPATVVVLWVPVALYFLYISLKGAGGYVSVARAAGLVFISWFFWALVECLLISINDYHNQMPSKLGRPSFSTQYVK